MRWQSPHPLCSQIWSAAAFFATWRRLFLYCITAGRNVELAGSLAPAKCMCILPLAQGLDELLAIMSGGADAASATASAIDAAAAAAADEAAEAAASGLGDWSSGTSVDVGLPDDVGGGGNGAAPELLMSKVVAARKTVLRASGHVDPLYLLEAVQVGGGRQRYGPESCGQGVRSRVWGPWVGPSQPAYQRKGGCWRVVCSEAVAWGSREQDRWWR